MREIYTRLANLNQEKRELLELLLKDEDVDLLALPIARQPRKGNPFPLSFAQERLWFLDQLVPGSSAYNLFYALRLSGFLNIDSLRQALNVIFRRHEALRTIFSTIEKQPMQMVSSRQTLEQPLIDLSDLPAHKQDVATQRLAESETSHGFDLIHGPLIRVKFIRYNETEHIVFFNIHHIVCDGWSMNVLIREVVVLYEALSRGTPIALSELPIQYADFAVWQLEQLQGDMLEKSLFYWKQRLIDLPVLQLPTDHPRPTIQTYRGARQTFTLSKDLSESIKALSRQEEVTLFTTLLAAFQALLHRYTGQKEIVVGSPIANRGRAELEDLIGFFVNTLIMCGDFSGNPNFQELLKRTQEMTIGAYAHQNLPFEKLVAELNPKRDPSRSPLFQVMFQLQITSRQTFQLPGLRLSRLEIGDVVSHFDLVLDIIDTTQGLTGELTYNTDLFDAATITRMIGHYQTLLEGIVANPERQISRLPLLSEDERHQILVDWNNTQIDHPKEICIHQLFRKQVKQTPDAVAAVFEAESLTYYELNRRANQLAHYLVKLGVTSANMVGICLERSLDIAIGCLGILKAGGAFVPLDPGYPKERLAFMLEDAQVNVLLTQEHLHENLTFYRSIVICLDTQWGEIAQQSAEEVISTITADNVAYTIYTSGSTGHPKGSLITHRALVNYTVDMVRHFGLESTDRVLQFAPISFDVVIEELFPSWLAGATVVFATENNWASYTELMKLTDKQQLTVYELPTNYWHNWVDELSLSQIRPPTSLRLVIIGGEKILPDRFAYWQTSGIPLLHVYGLTETTVTSTLQKLPVSSEESRIEARFPIGRPIANTQIYLLDSNLQPVPIGISGELYIGGMGLALSYINQPAMTAERFMPNPFSRETGARLYRTGDQARYLPSGEIEFLGRIDEQVKLRGFRVEVREVEATLLQHPAVREAAVIIWEDTPGDKRLIAYLVTRKNLIPILNEIRAFLSNKLPSYMLPSRFIMLDKLPLTFSGKVDRRALPAPDGTRPELASAYTAPNTTLEQMIGAVWQEILQLEQVGIHDNFFDLGGHSLLLAKLHSRLTTLLEQDVTIIDLFQYPTIYTLTQYLNQKQEQQDQAQASMETRQELVHRQRNYITNDQQGYTEIAIVGMVGRFPGAKNLTEFWENLKNGKESISFFTKDELIAAGIEQELLDNPNYVKAKGVLEESDLLDALFFGFTPREAEIMDPQHRIFLECAWEALESAGYNAEKYEGLIGVYAGANLNSYLLSNLATGADLLASVGHFQVVLGNEKDFLPTRVSYKLGLRGPSINIQTACSTSLVAVHLASQGLRTHECDIALAGGITIVVPQKAGYLYQKESILSPDGHCRAFDANAAGTVGSEGVGIVVLKRLEDALADGDTIHAILKGSAINNDGSSKVGYTAPGINGQVEVIRTAQMRAKVEPELISYLETHGAGTILGDPIEVTALTRAFQVQTQAKEFCAIGSVKTNIGHLDAAAGVASLIKTVLAIKHQLIPPHLNFEAPNPAIDFVNTPFYVNTTPVEWKTNGRPRRAGVSSFGLGGTNAHVVVEEAPSRKEPSASRPWHLFLLSAKTDSALDAARMNLVNYLKKHSDLNPADVAYTLQIGRKAFSHRYMLLCRDVAGAINALETNDATRILFSKSETNQRPVAFMFSGLGDHYPNMGGELYHHVEATFRDDVDHCCELLKPHLGLDLRQVLFHREEKADNIIIGKSGIDLRQMLLSSDEQAIQTTQKSNQTELIHPMIFVLEYALAKLWMSWGLQPAAMIGYSLGEYVAACLAGVFSLEDALFLVAKRAQMIQQLPSGKMLAVALSEQELHPLLGSQLSLSAMNGPSSCVIAGPNDAVTQLEKELNIRKVACRRLKSDHAFHSAMMEPLIEPFTQLVKTLKLQPPKIPYISTVTGTWIKAEEAADPAYWAQHLCQPVRFADGISKLWQESSAVLLEIGPGQTLSSLVIQHPVHKRVADPVVLPSLKHAYDHQSDSAFLLTTLGKLWLAGIEIDWPAFYKDEKRHRIPLPTYPFERQRYWIEPPKPNVSRRPLPTERAADIDDWFYIPVWRLSEQLAPAISTTVFKQKRNWLIFTDELGMSNQLIEHLEQMGQTVVSVLTGNKFSQQKENVYTIDPHQREDYSTLLRELSALGKIPATIIHLWSITQSHQSSSVHDGYNVSQYLGFYSLHFLIQGLADLNVTHPLQLVVVSNCLQKVNGEPVIYPERATSLGVCKVISQEHPNITCCSIDISDTENLQNKRTVQSIINETRGQSSEAIVAYRGAQRWVQSFEAVQLKKNQTEFTNRLRTNGVYLITGGLGGIGFTLAEYLAQSVQAKLVLIGRSELPKREDWKQWLATHEDNNNISCKLQKIQALEKKGAEVMVLSADVANQKQMESVIRQTYDKFGILHGVIHAAGVVGGGLVQLRTPEMAENVLAPKVIGTLVLDTLLRGKKLDFFVLCSSHSSILGGLGEAAYSAANVFLDTFALGSASKGDSTTISINWDIWKEVGMAVNTEAPFGLEKEWQGLRENGLSCSEGVAAFQCILAHGFPQVVVSKQPFLSLIKQSNTLTKLTLKEQIQTFASQQQSNSIHSRPLLRNAYVAPRNEIESKIADIWQLIFGVTLIGIHDSFFELGGHSLIAIQLLDKLHQVFQVEISIKQLFETPTIADLSKLINAVDGASIHKKLSIREQLLEISYDTRRNAIEDYIKEKVADALGIEVNRVPANGDLHEIDLESITSHLIWDFKQDLQCQFYPNEILRRPSVVALAVLIEDELRRTNPAFNQTATLPFTLVPQSITQKPVHNLQTTRTPQKNPGMVFLLSAPRSGSTLLRVMLAGHPALFSPPELGLLLFHGMAERSQNLPFANFDHHALQRVFRELLHDPVNSESFVNKLVEQDRTIQEVYLLLQELVQPRLLVDKTPDYALSIDVLRRAEAWFEGNKYIHLIRHPYSVVESWVRNRFDKYMDADRTDPYLLAEHIWAMSNSNILDFYSQLQSDRYHLVRYEELVTQPESVMASVCEFLDIPFDEAVLHPYEGRRMRDGISDPGFLRHDQIDASLAEIWKQIKLPRPLSRHVRYLASELGYELLEDHKISESIYYGPEKTFIAPRDPVEEVLASIVAQLLGIERVSIYDRFSELGGDTIFVSLFIDRIQEALEVELTMTTLLEAPTVADLAIAIQKDSSIQSKIERNAELLLSISQLSDKEVDVMLKEKIQFSQGEKI